MKKPLKIGIGVVAVFVVLVIALAILAKVLITPERVRSTVLPIAEDALAREVHLGEIEVSIFSGILLKDLAVKEKAGEGNFVSADEVVLDYQFWPLLFLQVVVDEIRLVSPRIQVTRMADGSFNFDDLLEGEKTATAEQPEPAGEERGPVGAPINLTVSEVKLTGGELLFIDRKINPDAPYRYQLSDLNVTASDVALDRSFPFAVQCRLNGSALSVDGQANVARQQGSAEVSLKDFDATAFAPYYREQIPGKLGSLKIGLDLKVEGSPQRVSSQGKITLAQLDLVLDALQEAALQDYLITLDYDLTADLATSRLDLASSRLNANGIEIMASGEVKNWTQTPAVDLQVKVPELELRKALDAVPPALVKETGELDPAGTISAEALLSGTLEDPAKLVQRAHLVLDGVRASVGGVRPGLSGAIDLTGDRLVSNNLVLQVGDNQADIELTASNLFDQPMIVKNSVTADRFILDPFLAPAAGVAEQNKSDQAPDAGEQKAPEEIGPFDIPVRAEGTVKIGEALYKGLAIQNFDMAYRLADNVLTVEKLNGRMAGGSFNKTARIDLGQKGLAYEAEIDLDSLQADPFMQAFVPAAQGTVFGNLSLDLSVSGKGTTVETIKKNLNGKGDLGLAEGRLTGAGLVGRLAGFLDLEELREIQVSQAQGNFVIEQGKVRLNSTFTGENLRAKPQGTIGLDGDLSLNLNALLAPQLTEKLGGKGKFPSFLKNEEGWAQLPLMVAGTFSSPRITLDTSGVAKQVEQKAREKLEKKVLEKLVPQDEDADEKSPEKKLLEDAVKGLFGK